VNGTKDVDHDVWQSVSASKKLAYELAAEGHRVDVVFSDANLLKDKVADETDRRIRYHVVDSESRMAFTGRFMSASPASHRVISQALPQWEKFIELHLQEPFDVLDANSSVLVALMPGLSRVVPTVCTVQDQMAIFQESSSPLAFQLLAMLERMTLNLVGRISVSSADLEKRLHKKVDGSLKKTDVVNEVDYTSAKLAQYRAAVESGKVTRPSQAYLKSPSDLSNDAVMIFKAYDEMIYNFLYQNSYRFRLYHWWHLFKSNPSLFQNKLKQFMQRYVGRPQN
jgi:hypothetical protein